MSNIFRFTMLVCLLLALGTAPAGLAQAPGTEGAPPPHLEAAPSAAPVRTSTLRAPAAPHAPDVATVTQNVLDPGDALVHGWLYYDGYLYGCTRTPDINNPTNALILKVDPSTLTVVGRTPLTGDQYEAEDIVYANGYLWVILFSDPAELVRVDPATMTATTAFTFLASQLRFGSALHYAFGYLWATGIDRLVRIDISNPLSPSYTSYDYSAEATNSQVVGHSLSSSATRLYAAMYQYDDPSFSYTADTFFEIDPAAPGTTYTTNTVAPLFPDDMVFLDRRLHATSEAVATSDYFQFSTGLTTITNTTVASTASYGAFANPLDPQHIWGVFTGSPGTLELLDFQQNVDLTLTLPTGYNDPSEVAFDELGNMYVVTWQQPAGVVKYSAPAAVADLSITRDGANALLEWSHTDPDVTAYRVWRSSQPYFSPGDTGSELLGEVAPAGGSASYSDAGIIGAGQPDTYYTVQAVNIFGLVSPPATNVGKIEVTLQPGDTANKYTHLALPLDMSGVIDTAGDIATYIGAGIVRVLRWNPTAQGFTTHIVGTPINDFAVSPGDTVMVFASSAAPTSFAWVGVVPPGGSIQHTISGNGYSTFSLLLDQDPALYATASDLAAGINANGGTVTRVLKWNPVAQGFTTHIVGTPINNFAVSLGEPYWALNSTEVIWP